MKNHQEINLSTQTTFEYHADEIKSLLHKVWEKNLPKKI